jgi:aminoglycoside phosphotransferase (APT) family kinase protein
MMHVGEVPIDVPLVRRLLEQQLPHWASLPVAAVASAGTDHAMYRLGDALAVRLPRIDWAVAAVAHEQRWLPWLAPRLPLAVPLPLAAGQPGAGYPYPWSVVRWLPGVLPRVGALADAPRLAHELARFLVALHRLPVADAPPAGRTIAQRDADVQAALAQLHALGLADVAPLAQCWQAARGIAAHGGAPVWIHGDIAPGNLLLVDDTLSAVIDWSGCGVGDPADDARIAWNLLPATARPAFRAALGLDAAAWARGRALAFSQALLQWPYYHQTNPTLAANARHVIAEVLRDVPG